jgi:hypothetical protein
MCMMNNFLSKYLDNFFLVLVDDILVYSKTKQEHEKNLNMVLQVFRYNQIYAKFITCDLFQK